MTITITSNGSKWAGEPPDSLDVLLAVLGEQPLDRRFEMYGNFVMPEPETGVTRFWGNFLAVSHVFSVDTDEPLVLEQLTKAIRANQQRPDYLEQPCPFAAKAAAEAAQQAHDKARWEAKCADAMRQYGPAA